MSNFPFQSTVDVTTILAFRSVPLLNAESRFVNPFVGTYLQVVGQWRNEALALNLPEGVE